LKTMLEHKMQQLRHELKVHHLKSQAAEHSQRAVEGGLEAAPSSKSAAEAAGSLQETEQRVHEAHQDQLASVNSLNELLDRAKRALSGHSDKSVQQRYHGENARELPTTPTFDSTDGFATHVLPFIEESKCRLSELEQQSHRQEATVAIVKLEVQALERTQDRFAVGLQKLMKSQTDMQLDCAKQCEPLIDVKRLLERLDRVEETQMQSNALRQKLEPKSSELLERLSSDFASQLKSTEDKFVGHRAAGLLTTSADSLHEPLEDELRGIQPGLDSLELPSLASPQESRRQDACLRSRPGRRAAPVATEVRTLGCPVEPRRPDAFSCPGSMAAPVATEVRTLGCPVEPCRQDVSSCSHPESIAAPVTTEACTRPQIGSAPTPCGVLSPLVPQERQTRAAPAAAVLVTRRVTGPPVLSGSMSDTAIGSVSKSGMAGATDCPLSPAPRAAMGKRLVREVVGAEITLPKQMHFTQTRIAAQAAPRSAADTKVTGCSMTPHRPSMTPKVAGCSMTPHRPSMTPKVAGCRMNLHRPTVTPLCPQGAYCVPAGNTLLHGASQVGGKDLGIENSTLETRLMYPRMLS
jgi:hypothetical protein